MAPVVMGAVTANAKNSATKSLVKRFMFSLTFYELHVKLDSANRS
jgi:hypothetical protein